MRWLFMVCVAALALTGCPDNPGRTPPRDQFFFPIAGAVDAEGRWLYVVNSDFDLAYNGGTVTAVDLDRVRARALSPEGNNCRADSDSPGAFLCDESPFIPRPDQTRRISPFAVDAAWVRYPAAGRDRLYVIVRGDGSLTWFDLNRAPDGTRDEGALDCGGAGDPNGACGASHRAGVDPVQGLRNDVLPPDPAALSVDESQGWITVVHQSTDPNLPRASLFRDPIALAGAGQSAAPQLMNVVGQLPAGLSALALVRRGDRSRSTWLATSRSEATFTLLQAYPGSGPLQDSRPFLYRAALAPVQGLNTGANSRAVALDPDPARNRAYVISRSPEALLTVDLSDLNRPVITEVLPLPLGPSRLTAATAVLEGGPRTLVFAVSYDSRRLTVIDPEARRVVTRLPTGRGPHQLVRDPRGELLFVLDFLDSTVEVVRLRPNMSVSPEQRTRCPDAALCRVLTLGLPSPPEFNR